MFINILIHRLKKEVQKVVKKALFILFSVVVNLIEIEMYVHKSFNILFAYITNFTEKQTHTINSSEECVSLMKISL